MSFVPPKHYFETMEVETTFDKMMELATKEGKDGRTQFQQLLAIRHLADEADAFKKSPKYAEQRQILEQIAAGKKANDPQGFAKEHAQKSIAWLDGKNWTPPAAPVLRDDALTWFPANATFAAAWDGRHTKNMLGANPSALVLDFLKMLPPGEQKRIFREAYTQAEKFGNIRFDRVALAYVDDEKEPNRSKIYLRFTGKADPQRIVDLLKLSGERFEVKTKKADDGISYIELRDQGSVPAILLIGDSEMVVIGHKREGENDILVKETLELRAKKQPDASKGSLKEALAKVPAKACAFMVGTLPEEFRRDIQRGFVEVPSKVQASIEQLPTGFDVHLQGVMAKGADSAMLVEMVAKGRQQAVQGMKQLQNAGQLPPGFPALPFQSMSNVLESMQINGKGPDVQLRMMVPNDVVQVMPMSLGFFGMAARPLAPPAQKVEVKKVRVEEKKK